ncbi:hypothetical protein RJ55_02848 [Drechmeria coniospora]|nr:hypothetical protein RJ55_02848 [Drechmeria coniospora]
MGSILPAAPTPSQPPSSQYSSGLAPRLAGVENLSESQKKCCDDLIILSSRANGTREVPSHESRHGLWRRVFSNHWTTDHPNKHPGPIRARRAVDAMTNIGTWRVDLPPSASLGKRKRNDHGRKNEHRKAGAAAFIKPNINWDDFGVSFSVCDANSANANAKYVSLREGWTLQQARAEAMIHWDERECQRVIEHNEDLVVCWARSRLITSLRALQSESHPITIPDEVTVNTDELVRLVTCADRVKEMATLIDESERIAGSRPIHRQRWQDAL